MEDLVGKSRLAHAFKGGKVLVTGHTGFQGGWLCLWLDMLGADVMGFGLEPEKGEWPTIFDVVRPSSNMKSITGDIRSRNLVREVVRDFKPDYVIHLAAQALVDTSIEQPVYTLETNVMGTVNLLDAVLSYDAPRAVLAVTSDKCYKATGKNNTAFTENAPLGGRDPYSASKACAEIVVHSFMSSFMNSHLGRNKPVFGIATARSGNVIGGGDWAESRLVPDCVKAFNAGKAVTLRMPQAVRPWQHVLQAISGYLWLLIKLGKDPGKFSGPWNMGPLDKSHVQVRQLVQIAGRCWGQSGDYVDHRTSDSVEEGLLLLDSTKARSLLDYRQVWPLLTTVDKTIAWYKACMQDRVDLLELSMEQIQDFTKDARKLGLEWC